MLLSKFANTAATPRATSSRSLSSREAVPGRAGETGEFAAAGGGETTGESRTSEWRDGEGGAILREGGGVFADAALEAARRGGVAAGAAFGAFFADGRRAIRGASGE